MLSRRTSLSGFQGLRTLGREPLSSLPAAVIQKWSYKKLEALPSFGHSSMSVDRVFRIVGAAVGTARFETLLIFERDR